MNAADFINTVTPDSRSGYGSATVVPSDTVNLTDTAGGIRIARYLEIWAAGTLSFVGADGVTDTRTYTGGMAFPLRLDIFVQRVNATGTNITAGNIKAVW